MSLITAISVGKDLGFWRTSRKLKVNNETNTEAPGMIKKKTTTKKQIQKTQTPPPKKKPQTNKQPTPKTQTKQKMFNRTISLASLFIKCFLSLSY